MTGNHTLGKLLQKEIKLIITENEFRDVEMILKDTENTSKEKEKETEGGKSS